MTLPTRTGACLTSSIVLAVLAFTLSCGAYAQTISRASGQAEFKGDTRVIDSLPAPNDEEIRKIRTADQWHNPYVIVHCDGYQLVHHDQPSSQAPLTLDELEETLLKMPVERWPLGRVVAVQESGLRSPGDGARIACNLSALKRMLESHNVRVDQWPSG
jgi:hypothetical protein